jgi:hypothetical protein
MNRLKVLTVVSSLFVFAAAEWRRLEMTKIYGPVYVTKSKHEHHEHQKQDGKKGMSPSSNSPPLFRNGVIVVKNGGDAGKGPGIERQDEARPALKSLERKTSARNETLSSM